MKEKMLIGGNLNLALEPIKYQYAYNMFQNCKKNFWTPEEVNIGEDISVYKDGLTEAEKHVFLHVFAQLSTMDTLAVSVVSDIANIVTSPEHSMALASVAFQEVIHTDSYKYCVEHLGIDSDWLWSRWEDVPAIKAKIDYSINMHKTGSIVERYFYLSGVFENIMFLGGFNPIFAMGRLGKLKRVTEILQYIARDESGHVGFGLATIRDMLREGDYDLEKTKVTFSTIISDAIALEEDYINFIFSEGSYIGYSVKEHMGHITYLAFNTMTRLGMDTDLIISPYTPLELPWIDEMLYTKKEKNFFETRVTEYQPLNWEQGNVLTDVSTVGDWQNNDERMNTETVGAVCTMEEGCESCQ